MNSIAGYYTKITLLASLFLLQTNISESMAIRISFGAGQERILIYSTGLTPINNKMNFPQIAFKSNTLMHILFVNRVSSAGYFIERHPSIVAKYKSLEHKDPVSNPKWLVDCT